MKDDNNRDRYMVVLNFEDKACHIPFALSGIHLTLSNAKEDLHDWSRKLNLI